MNLKSSLSILATFLVGLAHASDYDPTWNAGGTGPDNFSWERKVPRSVIEKAPYWTPDQGTIPVSPDQACEKAAAAFNQLGLGTPTFKTLQLLANKARPTTYTVSLEDKDGHFLDFLIFMDGTVISPVITRK